MIARRDYKFSGMAADRILLVMLPGAGIEADEFAANGMVKAVHGRGLNVDVIATRPDIGLYLDGEIPSALHQEIILPALAQGYRRIWLLGISLGGMGALLYASAHAGLVEGIALLAPFLGTRGTVAELTKAGGLAAWRQEGSQATDAELRMLLWVQAHIARRPEAPKLYLGYGQEDRFAPGHRLLAAALPPERVVAASGGHDWDTWLALWEAMLDARPFGPAALDDGRACRLSSPHGGKASH